MLGRVLTAYINDILIYSHIDKSYELKLLGQSRVHAKYHISRLKLAISGSSYTGTPPTPLKIDGQLTYRVSNIRNTCCRTGQLEYLVKWENYGPETQCWVPHQDIPDLRLPSCCLCSVISRVRFCVHIT